MAFSGEVRLVVERRGESLVGIVSADDFERAYALDARWAEGHEILKRFGREVRERTAEEIEEAVAQAVADVRGDERCRVEGRPGIE